MSVGNQSEYNENIIRVEGQIIRKEKVHKTNYFNMA